MRRTMKEWEMYSEWVLSILCMRRFWSDGFVIHEHTNAVLLKLSCWALLLCICRVFMQQIQHIVCRLYSRSKVETDTGEKQKLKLEIVSSLCTNIGLVRVLTSGFMNAFVELTNDTLRTLPLFLPAHTANKHTLKHHGRWSQPSKTNICIYALLSFQFLCFQNYPPNHSLLQAANRIWSKSTSCLTVSALIDWTHLLILVPLMVFLKLLLLLNCLFLHLSCVLHSAMTIGSALHAEHKFPSKLNPELQRFSQFLGSFSFEDNTVLWCGWTLLQCDTCLISILRNRQMILQHQMSACILNENCHYLKDITCPRLNSFW